MTIDEYLNQLPKLRRAEAKAYNRMETKFDRATSLQSSFNFDMPRRIADQNATEARLVELADAQREWKEANEAYATFKEQLERSLYNLLYWEGLLIDQAYIYNVIYGRDHLYGLDEILKTRNRGVMISKLNEAKQHLRQILIDQGIEIE